MLRPGPVWTRTDRPAFNVKRGKWNTCPAVSRMVQPVRVRARSPWFVTRINSAFRLAFDPESVPGESYCT